MYANILTQQFTKQKSEGSRGGAEGRLLRITFPLIVKNQLQYANTN